MESYDNQYERMKKVGARVPVRFFPLPPLNEEYRIIMDNPYNIPSNMYAISNFGNVVKIETNMIVNQFYDKNGYHRVCLSGVTCPVHRLEMMVFDPNPNYRNLQVNHIDGNPSNNTITNLEWVTPKENSDHAMINGLHKMNGTCNPNNKLDEKAVREICELIQTHKYYDTEIAEMYNVSYANISDIHKGKIWTSISKDYDLSERKPRSLTPAQVHEICKMLESGEYFTTEIAKKFNTSHTNIAAIRDGEIWSDISKDYNLKGKSKPRKFTKEKVREICEVMQTGQYFDSEIARMYGTTSTFMRGLRTGQIHKDVTKDFDMTIRKHT